MKVDTSRFDRALKEYIATTSRDMVTALNGKAKDLALRSARATPITKETAAAHKAMMTSPAFITHSTAKKHGKGFTMAQRQAVAEKLAKRRLGKGYMKSGYVKAGNSFKNTGDASRIRAEARADPSQPSKARVRQASRNILAAVSEISWKATGSKDASEKQGIVSESLASGAAFVVKDMEDYLARKMGATAKKVSA